MADSFSISFDDKAIQAALDRLGEGAKDAVRPAAQAGADVLYREVRARAPRADGPHVGRGGKVYQPGTLQNAIYQAFSADNSTEDRATYHISWNARKAGHGHLIEYGYFRRYKAVLTKQGRWITTKTPLPTPVWVPGHSFVRSSFDAKYQDALRAAQARFEADIKQTIASLG